MSSEEVDFEFPLEVALHNVENFGRLQEAMIEQHAGMFKWLLASLLAINGGGAIAVMNATNLALVWKLDAALAFSFGICAAMLSGQLGQKFNMKSLGPVSKRRGYWLAVSQSGVYIPADSNELDVEYNRSTKWAWTVPAAGWLSAAMFAAGAVCVGIAMANAPALEQMGLKCRQSPQASAS